MKEADAEKEEDRFLNQQQMLREEKQAVLGEKFKADNAEFLVSWADVWSRGRKKTADMQAFQ